MGTKQKKMGKKPAREETDSKGTASTDTPHGVFGFETQELLNLAIEAEEGEQRARRQHQEDMERQRRAFPGSTEEELVSRVLAAEEMAEMEDFQNAEDRAAEEEWREMEKERAFAEQQDKFRRLKEAQQMRKQARLADWAVWREHQDAMKVENELRARVQQAADWAAWTNEQAKEYDRVQAKLKAKEFRDWEQWVVLNEPPDEPKGQRQVRVEAGVTVGDTQPVKKARWTFKLAQGLAHKIGFHFTIQTMEDEAQGLATTETRRPHLSKQEEWKSRGKVHGEERGAADAGAPGEAVREEPGAGGNDGSDAAAQRPQETMTVPAASTVQMGLDGGVVDLVDSLEHQGVSQVVDHHGHHEQGHVGEMQLYPDTLEELSGDKRAVEDSLESVCSEEKVPE